jgi:hypothetical protein
MVILYNKFAGTVVIWSSVFTFCLYCVHSLITVIHYFTSRHSMCVALVIQHAKRMRRIILSSVACLTRTVFFHIISQTA